MSVLHSSSALIYTVCQELRASHEPKSNNKYPIRKLYIYIYNYEPFDFKVQIPNSVYGNRDIFLLQRETY